MRKYTGTLQYFHNFEHDPEGLNHCHSDGDHPYTVKHENGKHIISHSVVRGHGRGGKPQWFEFTERLGDGYDMASAKRIDAPPPQRKATQSITGRKPRISGSRAPRITPKRPKLRR